MFYCKEHILKFCRLCDDVNKPREQPEWSPCKMHLFWKCFAGSRNLGQGFCDSDMQQSAIFTLSLSKNFAPSPISDQRCLCKEVELRDMSVGVAARTGLAHYIGLLARSGLPLFPPNLSWIRVTSLGYASRRKTLEVQIKAPQVSHFLSSIECLNVSHIDSLLQKVHFTMCKIPEM